MFSESGAVSRPGMEESLGYLNNVPNDYQQLQLTAFEGEDHVRGPQPSPQTTEEVTVTGYVQPALGQQQTTVVTSDQQPHQLVINIIMRQAEAEAESEDRLESALRVTLGQNHSNPIWQLILIATFNLVAAATVGVLFLPRNLEEVHSTYWRVMLIANTAVPIAVAMITFFVCFRLASNPGGQSNLITGLSVANLSLLLAPLAVYLEHQ